MRGNSVSHHQGTLPPADANHVKVIPGIRGAGATLSRNTESHHDGNQTDCLRISVNVTERFANT